MISRSLKDDNMLPIPNNTDVVCYFVTKHSWRGKYKRIFSVGTHGITTYNPNSLEITNRYSYNQIISIQVDPQNAGGFVLSVRDKNKLDKFKFSTDFRSNLLTDALKFRHQFSERGQEEIYNYEALKYHWSDTRLPVTINVTPISIEQLDTATAQVLASYRYKDIEAIQHVEDIPGGFVVISRPYGRMHLFISSNREEIFQKVKERAMIYLQIPIEFFRHSITHDDFLTKRLGRYSSDEHVTSVCEFQVKKIGVPRHQECPQRRLLCLSEVCLLERDPQTYTVVTLRPLSSVFALIRDPVDAQQFCIEYADSSCRSYTATNRDSLLATLLDSVRSSGNHHIHVKLSPTPRDKRLIPFNVSPDQEIESNHLKCIKEPPPRKSFAEVLDRFNANIEYSGLIHSVSEDKLFTENKEKLIVMALTSIIAHQGDQNEIAVHELEAQFHALRRLFATKAGFSTFIMLPELKDKLGRKVTRALKRDHEAITHAALDMICTLMQPMHRDSDIRQEQLNKASLLATSSFLESLLDMWVEHIKRGTGALVVSAMLDILTFALCVPYSETTDGTHFDTLLALVAKRGRYLFQLFQHPSLTVVKGAGLVMRAIIEEGDAEISGRMQELALAEAALPSHLLTALFTRDDNRRMLVHRQLSRHLVGLWVTNNTIAMDLLARLMPSGLIRFLESSESVEMDENEDHLITRDNLKLAQDHAAKNQRNPHLVALERKLRTLEKEVEIALGHWGASLGLERKEDKLQVRPIVLRRRRERIKSQANWKLFYYKFNKNHTSPSLLWNHQTREELHDALKKEIQAFNSDRQLTTNSLIAWNHDEFEVQYPSLQDEVCIDGYYLRLLLDGSIDFAIKNPFRFFYDLYHRFLLALKIEMKCLCLQAMTVIYGQYFEEIGPFTDTKYILVKLDKTVEKLERDRLLLFLNKLVLNKQNVKDIIESKGVTVLVDLLTLAHLHTTRAVVPTQSNLIEAGQDMLLDNEKQWYYGLGNGDKSNGPITFQEMKDLYKEGVLKPMSKCWTPGLEGWKPLFKLSQFKWTVLAKDQSYMNESDLASLILSMLIKMCQYYPSRDNDGAIIWPIARIRRALTDSLHLPHVVQLLLTFDPILVEKVAYLLCEIASDNPNAAKLYMTGVFFFLLMYTGSNILPIAKFLRLTHTCQAFRNEEVQSGELMQRSVLGPLLPEAMVFYLENHGPEKFAQIFLGEFDTPEAIWNAEMRRMLIEKIACHIADFTPKLRGNNRAYYQYCAIPVVRYPQLQSELFCNIFYLRHLCDVQRFPDWPINDPITLLKDVLEAWKNEVEKKPPVMSIDDAYMSLGLERGHHYDEATTRKAYYKLAQANHPDKNPKGREIFVAANRAYDFLCSRSLWVHDGPNPNNILLILQTQSILFHRYSKELEPYKYAGYKQLVQTIRLEASDEQLFSKGNMLLAAASELTYHTVNCSALNAEELNREQGFIDLLGAYSRCVSVLNKSSTQTEMSVLVCTYCTLCFKVASQFPMCRDTFSQMPQLVNDITRILYFKNLPKLHCDAVDCISAMASDSNLQMSFLQKGAIWHLLTYMFSYDYTLEECGVERSEEANNQEVLNRLSKLSVKACARLGGYYEGDLSTPENLVAKSLFEKLLTPYIAEQLSEENPHQLLKTLGSNCETPYMVWDNSTRAELSDFLDTMCNRKESVNLETIGLTFSSHRNELIVGNIFIRVFNEQPQYTIKNPKAFLLDLLEYIKANNPLNNILDEKRVNSFIMVLKALNNLILNNPGLEVSCIGYFDLLFSLLRVETIRIVQNCALNIILTVTKNNECITDIANSGVVVYVLLCLYSTPSDQMIILDILITLSTSSTIVKDILNKGGHLFAVDLLCNGDNESGLRDKSAMFLSRLMTEKLSGPRLRLALAQILPLAIVDTMRDLPSSTVRLLDNDQENPELVWNKKSRTHIFGNVNKISREHYIALRQNPKGVIKLPDTSIVFSSPTNETVVAGVYLRLFNNNPGWNVRRPKEFLSELLDTCISSMTKEKNDKLEIVTTSIVKLLEAQPHLSDQVPALGHIPRLCFQLSLLSNPDVPKSVLMILHQLSLNEVCVGCISQTECIGPMKKAMQENSNLIYVSSETLSRMFAAKKDYLVKQALDTDLISYLVGLLDGRLDGVNGSARAKAQIVKALKTMSLSLSYGSLVQAQLDKLPAWSSYKDQNHDLFISSAPSMPYLMGVQSVGGYLTEGRTNSTASNVPPPLIKKDYSPY